MARQVHLFWCMIITLVGLLGARRVVCTADEELFQWKRLTQENFTSIHSNAFTLCIVMLSWCGEGRSLIREISTLVKNSPDEFTALHYRYVYVNLDRSAVKSLPTIRSPSVFLFHKEIPFLYKGRLLGSHILEGVRYGMRSSESGFPVQRLETSENVIAFAGSSDRVFFFLDFCGLCIGDDEEMRHQPLSGTPLSDISKEKHNDELGPKSRGDENAVRAEKSPSPHASKNAQLVDDLEELVLDTPPHLSEATIGLHTWTEVILPAVDTMSTNATKIGTRVDPSCIECTELEKRRCRNVFENFTQAAAMNALTPYRIKFGLISSKSVAAESGLIDQGDSSLWKLMGVVQEPFRVPDVYEGEGDVGDFIASVSPSLVTELKGEGYHQQVSASYALLSDKPSILLFINRGSASPEVRGASQDALVTTRGAAFHFATLNKFHPENQEATSVQPSGTLWEKEMSSEEFLEASIPKGLHQHSQSLTVDRSDILSLLKSVNSGAVKMQSESGGFVMELKAVAHNQDSHSLLQDLIENHRKQKATLSASDLFNLLLGTSSRGTSLSNTVLGESIGNDKHSSDEVKENSAVNIDEVEDNMELVASSNLDHHLKGKAVFTRGTDDEGQGRYCSRKTTDEHTLEKGRVGISGINEECSRNGEVGFDDLDLRTDHAGVQSSVDDIERSTHPLEHFFGIDRHQTVEYDEHPADSLGLDLECSGKETERDHKVCKANAEVDMPRNVQLVHLGEALDVSDSFPEADKLGDAESKDLSAQHAIVQIQKNSVLSSNVSPRISFFFRDGDDSLMEKLAMTTKTPAVVVIFPKDEVHYVHPIIETLTQSSLIAFINQCFSGRREETVRSETPQLPIMDVPQPPFVNRDFHDHNSVPRLTVTTFDYDVLGLRYANLFADDAQSKQREVDAPDSVTPAWRKDVVVLFTTPWCGFCKRMEIVVREVYRAVNYNMGSSVHGCDDEDLGDARVADLQASNSEEAEPNEANSSHRNDGLPSILQMDCTLNDCDYYLRHLLDQDETYPAVVLYPAQKKHAPVIYEGAPEIQSLYRFIATNGMASSKLACRVAGTFQIICMEKPYK
uniref:Thioredoxin domain-containing protein n=1 Tax=Physcomitrium patens TaxID=3218 RepID=A0A7I4FU06_PHYPA